MLADTSAFLVTTEHNAGHLVHFTLAVYFRVVDRLFDVYLFVHRGVVVVLAFGAIADLVGVLIRVNHVDVVLVWNRFLVPRCCLACVLRGIVSEIEVVGCLLEITSKIFHQRLVLWVDVWVLPSKICPCCRVVIGRAVTKLIVRGFEVVRWRYLFVSLSALVVLNQTRLRSPP